MSWFENWMAVTDLDGTLLDHDDYSWQPAAKAVATLKEHGVPLVLASSKTLAEMSLLASELGIHHPMIVENGAAVAWPEGEDYRVEAMGSSRGKLVEVIHQLREEKGWQFSGFADWSAEEVAEDCGLDPERAELALQRHGTEPLVWEDSEDAYNQFLAELESRKIRAVRGGRYIHVMGEFDKADGLKAVAAALGKGSATPLRIIAFGDSPNDEAMLCAANVAVRIRSRKSSEMQVQAPVLLQPEQPGPYGWAEAFEQWWRAEGEPSPSTTPSTSPSTKIDPS